MPWSAARSCWATTARPRSPAPSTPAETCATSGSYPGGATWAHVTGYHSLIFGRAQLERSYNTFLSGAAPDGLVLTLSDLLEGREEQGDT